MGKRISFWLAVVAGIGLTACADDGPVQPGLHVEGPSLGLYENAGAVYVMSNAASGNEILVFERAADGTLADPEGYATGGYGTGGALGNQGSLALGKGKRHLYAVNAASDDISAFAVMRNGLDLVEPPTPSGGDMPISVTVHGNLLYVLNAGGAGNISGFRIGTDGGLTPIDGSIQPLGGVAPSQIGFTPDGNVLVVTEKGTNTISTYTVDRRGVAAGPNTFPSAGQTPFGFSFSNRGVLVVSDAAGGAPGASTASSYWVMDDGTLQTISGAVPTTQTAACWVVVSPNGRHAYTTNTPANTVSSLALGADGSLELVEAVAAFTGDGTLPQDAAFAPGGRFLYVRNDGGTIGAFQAAATGELTDLGPMGDLPAGANGMAVR